MRQGESSLNSNESVIDKHIEQNNEYRKIKHFDFLWIVAMFGTAVGAGVLFLPIRAGLGGIYPVLIMLGISLPMVYFAHRGFARFVNSSKEIKSGTEVADESFGKRIGYIVSVLYIFILYPVCLAYGLGITNTVDSFLINQIGIKFVPKYVVAIVLISAMMYVMAKNRVFMLKFTSWLVYPLITILFVFSIYLIPQWKMDLFKIQSVPSPKDFVVFVLASLPILVYSFNHFPIISSFVMDLREFNSDKEIIERKINKVFLCSALMITGFALFFVISCTLTLTQAQLLEARDQNISVLSYFSNQSDNMLLAYFGPIIAFTAIFSSFFGHYLAAQEGFKNIIYRQIKSLKKEKDEKKVNRAVMLFIYMSMIVVSIVNPSILTLIEDMGAPLMAVILLLMPLYAIYKVPAMKKYSGSPANWYVGIFGFLVILVVLYKGLAYVFGI